MNLNKAGHTFQVLDSKFKTLIEISRKYDINYSTLKDQYKNRSTANFFYSNNLRINLLAKQSK